MQEHKYTNSLINETSPYLLQHAHNPVNWMPWNDETLKLARMENKLILISVGYSSCHWCHVMEEESFEDEEVAALMNKYFINIKVDREERPDIDQIYMNAVQLMTGRGGWPLNCIALPDGRPIWGGTYFQKGKWMSALAQLSNLYKTDLEKLQDFAAKLTEGIMSQNLITLNTEEVNYTSSDVQWAVDQWKGIMDFELGGRNGAPKFPMPVALDFLLHYGTLSEDESVLNYVNTSLTKMAYGGIYDQLGGGFSRYSVDKKWHVPHFEKMLYDNGQLVSIYSKAYQATGLELYKNIVFGILEFVERDLWSSEGAFYSSLDADSMNTSNEMEEGAFYVWTTNELKELLQEDFDLFSTVYNMNEYGHWENGNYVLIRKEDKNTIVKREAITVADLDKKIDNWKSKLLNVRSKRDKPRLDDKSLTSWNALMLKGYVDAYVVFGEERFLKTALKNAGFIVAKQMNEHGGLNHSYKNGKSTINGYLEDYASVIDAFILLYEATLNEQWLTTSKQLTDYVFDHFFDTDTSMFFFTSDLDAKLITRKMELEDNVIPASNSIMAHNLFKLSHYYSNNYYSKVSRQMLNNMKETAAEYGSGYANWLRLMTNFASEYYEIAIAGEQALEKLKIINGHYIPNKLIAGGVKSSTIALMENRFIEGSTMIFICVDGTCMLPESDANEALKQVKLTFNDQN